MITFNNALKTAVFVMGSSFLFNANAQKPSKAKPDVFQNRQKDSIPVVPNPVAVVQITNPQLVSSVAAPVVIQNRPVVPNAPAPVYEEYTDWAKIFKYRLEHWLGLTKKGVTSTEMP